MEHNTCRENLSAYLDGELPANERLSLESHLAACADCSRELAELKKVSAVLKMHAMRPVPLSLKAAVFAKAPRQAWYYSWLKPAAALSAAAAGLLLFLNLPEDPDRGPITPAAYSASEGLSRPAGEETMLTGGSSGVSAAAGDESPRYAEPSFRKKGARAQAKFAGAAPSKARAAAPAAASFAGDAAGSSFLAAGAVRTRRGSAAAAGKSEAPPQWVKDLIRRYEKGQPGNPALSVWQFDYKGKRVYYLPPQCCDQYSELYDEKGKLLCAPDGGMTGQGDGNCGDFFELRKNGRLLWRDARGWR